MTKNKSVLSPETEAAIRAFEQLMARRCEERFGPLPKDGITRAEYSQRHGTSRSAAHHLLDTAVNRGLAKKSFHLLEGRRTAVYAIVDSPAFEALRGMKTRTRPEGAFTIAEYARRHGITRNAAKGRLAAALEQGTVKKSFVFVPSDSGSKRTAVLTNKR